MHILLVEPDVLQARVYGAALQRAGYSVMCVVSAQQAVHAADEQLPDIVVLELQLPGHNGVEFLYEFRSYQEWQDVPIVVHTFVAPGELQHNAATLQKELGICHVLYKPKTTLVDLCSAIQQLAGEPRTVRTP